MEFADFTAIILIGVGLAAGAFGFIRLLVAASRVHLLWLVACVLLPVAVIPFAIMHWDHARKGAKTFAIGVASWLAGGIVTAITQVQS